MRLNGGRPVEWGKRDAAGVVARAQLVARGPYSFAYAPTLSSP
jgi:hypothetical protein